MKGLYNENFKTLTKEIEELSKLKFLCSWANSIHTVMSKMIRRFTKSLKIPVVFYTVIKRGKEF